jgi:plastocyanin
MNLRTHPSFCLLTVLLSLFAASAAFGQAYEVAPVTGGGRVEGKVTFLGEVPIKKIIPNKDVEICGGPRDEVRITVGADKGVRDAVVYLKEVKKGKAWGAADKTPLLENKRCIFEPAVQVIRPGKLDIMNSDAVLHTTHGYYGGRNAFNVAMPVKDMKISKPVLQPGYIRVQCDTHNWMHSHLHVADSPYYVVTGADGKFSITDVPPGTYTLVTWQHHVGATETKITVKAGEAVVANSELKKL